MGFGSKVVKHHKVIMAVAIVLLIPAIVGMINTRINYDMLTYLPEDMETVQGQNILMDDFGKGGFSIITVESTKANEVKVLEEKIADVDYVDTVLNLESVVNPSVPIDMYSDELKDNIENTDATMLIVFFETSTSADETLSAIDEIREIKDDNFYVSGLSALVNDLKRNCEKEEPIYVTLAVVFACLIMMLLLDSYLAPIIFLVSIGIAILYNMGTNYFMGEISYITKAIAAVLQLGVTMDYSIFLWHAYEENIKVNDNHKEAMAKAIDSTLVSVSGSSITTIAGFLALCFMSYTMGTDLGIVMAKGVVLGVISSITILPSLLLIFDRQLKKTRHRSLIPNMDNVARKLTSRYAIYLIIFVALLFPAIHGYNNTNLMYDFTTLLSGGTADEIAEELPFIEANDKLEEDFNIGTTHMIVADSDMPAKDGGAMSEAIGKIDGVNNVIGVDALLGPAIPKDLIPNEYISSLVCGDKQLIMINSEYKVSTDDCNNQVDEIKEVMKTYDEDALLIGEGPCTKDLISITDRDFKIVSWISILAVFAIIALVLKSISLPIILVTVIEFAIFINLGITSYTGLELPFIVPICISTIQLGSTVDYAILMTSRYKLERGSGIAKRESIEKAVSTSIPSIIVSALGFFAATFGVGLYSNVSIISMFCNLMARGAVISMLAVILVLPSMLMLLDGVICKTTIGMKKKDKGILRGKLNEKK